VQGQLPPTPHLSVFAAAPQYYNHGKSEGLQYSIKERKRLKSCPRCISYQCRIFHLFCSKDLYCSSFIYLFIHHTACSPQAMAGKVQINNSEQEQQMKTNTGKTKNPWLGSTILQSPVTPALVIKELSRNHSGL
jgi:hypothetical protein